MSIRQEQLLLQRQKLGMPVTPGSPSSASNRSSVCVDFEQSTPPFVY